MSKVCVECGQDLAVVEVDDPKHYAQYQCINAGCSKRGRYAGWVPKPRDGNTRRKANRKLLKKLDVSLRDFCQLCTRTSAALDRLNPGLQLEVHHVIEVQDGGTDEASNLWVLCSECHELVHRQRRAFNRYPGFEQHLQPTEQCQQSHQPSQHSSSTPVDKPLPDLLGSLSRGL